MATLPCGAPSANPLAQLPPSVADYLRRLIQRLNKANERVHVARVGIGSYSAELAAAHEAPAMAKCRIELVDFRAIAGKNGFDADALIGAAALDYGMGEFASFRAIVSTSRTGGR